MLQSSPKAVIFDLDGTLVSSSLNFLKLCEETGCTPGEDILKYRETLAPSERTRVDQIIYEHEMRDAESASVIDGVHEMLDALNASDIDTAIITRNSEEATKIKLSNAKLRVEHVITREQAPPKPAPDALLQLADVWQHDADQCVYVGDFRYDLEAARNAGMHAAWFSNGIETFPSYADLAHFHFDHFDEFIQSLVAYWQRG